MAFRLCGVAATDFSLASRTLALDLQGLRWADELLEEVGVPPDLFAPLRESGSALGPVSREAAGATGLPEGACVAAGGHDHVCGALAVGVTEKGTMLNSLGTAEAIFLPLERPLTDPRVGNQGYTQGAHVAGQYYVFGGQYTSGASVEWLREILDGADYDILISEAENVPPGSFGAFFLPHLRLANPPYDDPAARGAFVGLSTDVGRGALFRAVLEGLAYDSRNSLEPLLAHAGLKGLRAIHAIGGGTQNRLLMSIKATVMNQEITVSGVEEATSLGAAILGGIGAGIYPDIPSALEELRYDEYPIEPVPDEVAFYDAAFRRYTPTSTPASAASTTRSRTCWPTGRADAFPDGLRTALREAPLHLMAKTYRVNHRCHLYQGTNTSTLSAGQAMLTARRPSLLASLYSCSIATLMMISPFSVDIGPVTARNPSMREPSSFSKSTCCPGSGTRGGLPLPNVISLPLASLVSQEQDIPTVHDPPKIHPRAKATT